MKYRDYSTRVVPPELITCAALAVLVAGGDIVPGRFYLIEQDFGGVLGVAQVLTQGVTANTVSQNVSVQTTFDNTAWAGRFDQSTCRIVDLFDNRGNKVRSTNGLLIPGFPWGDPLVSNNDFFDVAVVHTPGGVIQECSGSHGSLTVGATASATRTKVDGLVSVLDTASVDELVVSISNVILSGTASLRRSSISTQSIVISSSLAMTRLSMDHSWIVSTAGATGTITDAGLVDSRWFIDGQITASDSVSNNSVTSVVVELGASLSMAGCVISASFIRAHDSSVLSCTNTTVSDNSQIDTLGVGDLTVVGCSVLGRSNMLVDSGVAQFNGVSLTGFSTARVTALPGEFTLLLNCSASDNSRFASSGLLDCRQVNLSARSNVIVDPSVVAVIADCSASGESTFRARGAFTCSKASLSSGSTIQTLGVGTISVDECSLSAASSLQSSGTLTVTRSNLTGNSNCTVSTAASVAVMRNCELVNQSQFLVDGTLNVDDVSLEGVSTVRCWLGATATIANCSLATASVFNAFGTLNCTQVSVRSSSGVSSSETLGTLTVTRSTFDRGFVTGNSTGSNTVSDCTVSSRANLTFMDSVTGCLVDATALLAWCSLTFSGTSTNGRVFQCFLNSNAAISVDDSDDVLISYSSVSNAGYLRVWNGSDGASVDRCVAEGFGRILLDQGSTGSVRFCRVSDLSYLRLRNHTQQIRYCSFDSSFYYFLTNNTGFKSALKGSGRINFNEPNQAGNITGAQQRNW